MTALQVMKHHLRKGEKLTYCEVNTRDGVILAEFPVPQENNPKLVKLAIKRQGLTNLAMIRKRR